MTIGHRSERLHWRKNALAKPAKSCILHPAKPAVLSQPHKLLIFNELYVGNPCTTDSAASNGRCFSSAAAAIGGDDFSTRVASRPRLEGLRQSASGHLVYASSSSVYGANTKLPFAESDNVDHPVSLYAATKKANELMAHSYAHLYGLACTGLRFFTVYGPWGRPDMSPFKFVSCVLDGKPIPVFNEGRMSRDFTYIDDIVSGVVAVIDKGAPSGGKQGGKSGDKPGDKHGDGPPYRLYNIGNNQPVPLLRYIEAFEKATGKKALLDLQPMQPGDVPDTYADTQLLEKATGFLPDTPIDVGVQRFVDWYRDYYKV